MTVPPEYELRVIRAEIRLLEQRADRARPRGWERLYERERELAAEIRGRA